MNKEVFAKRQEVLTIIEQSKEAIARIAQTGVPLTRAEMQLVSLCLSFTLGEVALRKLLKEIPRREQEEWPDYGEGFTYDYDAKPAPPTYDLGPEPPYPYEPE